MFEDRGGHTTGRIPSYGFLVDTVTDYCIGNAVYEYFCEDDYTVGSNKIFCATNREACVMTEDGAECIGSTTDTPDGDVNFGNVDQCYILRLQYTINGIDTTFGDTTCLAGTTKIRAEIKKDSSSANLITIAPYPNNIAKDATKLTVTYCCKQ
ncbi:MAG TPA: hypothetical protein VJB89_04135 [Candidatus Nanoarchaeia archaeon]|nr:hypothetical protein [Candidatus Nanoarchaeia archaeon]